MRYWEMSAKIRTKFERGEKVVQEYTIDPKRNRREPTNSCSNCRRSLDIRYFEKLGNTCIFCFAEARKCSGKDCENMTVMKEGKCRDCYIGKEEIDYRAVAFENHGESALSRCSGSEERMAYGTGEFLPLLRRRMIEKGICTMNPKKAAMGT